MDLETILFGIMLGGLTLYLVFGGADFGVGVWEFNTALRASEEEREFLYRAIGPVWEANHVWLIFILVGVFNAFPVAFEGLCRALWVPLLLALVGIIFRGVAFAFRSYAAGEVRQQAAWGAVFAFASTAAPFFLGASAGAIASGRLEVAVDGSYGGDPLFGWLNPLSIYVAVFFVGLCGYLSAVFLAREATVGGKEGLAVLWRRRALGTGIWMGLLAMAGIVVVAATAPALWEGFHRRAWPFVAGSIVTGLLSLGMLWKKRFTAAAVLVVATAATVPVGWGVAQYPELVPTRVSIHDSKAPDAVLRTMIWAIAAGGALLLPALGFLFYLFKGKRPAGK